MKLVKNAESYGRHDVIEAEGLVFTGVFGREHARATISAAQKLSFPGSEDALPDGRLKRRAAILLSMKKNVPARNKYFRLNRFDKPSTHCAGCCAEESFGSSCQ